MFNTARALDTYHLPSVATYRLRNAPAEEDRKPGALACSECGSESVYGEYHDTHVARCHECQEVWECSTEDLADFQQYDPWTAAADRPTPDDGL